VIITLGFTESDRHRGYTSFSDGYRIGALQMSVTIAIEGGDSRLPAQPWAEAAFVASHQPDPSANPAVAAIQRALAEQVTVPLRTLSVGDTVTVGGHMFACEPAGRRRVDACDHHHADQPPPSSHEHTPANEE
jgi:hypothetical protein